MTFCRNRVLKSFRPQRLRRVCNIKLTMTDEVVNLFCNAVGDLDNRIGQCLLADFLHLNTALATLDNNPRAFGLDPKFLSKLRIDDRVYHLKREFVAQSRIAFQGLLNRRIIGLGITQKRVDLNLLTQVTNNLLCLVRECVDLILGQVPLNRPLSKVNVDRHNRANHDQGACERHHVKRCASPTNLSRPKASFGHEVEKDTRKSKT